jgi:hypothetical protein
VTGRYTVRYASARLFRLWLFYGRRFPSTFQQPPYDRAYGAIRVRPYPEETP